MSYLEEYQQKLTTAEEAVKVVKSGDLSLIHISEPTRPY